MKTRTELVHRALSEMGRLYAGEAPSAEDYSAVNDLVEPLTDQLVADDVVYVGDLDQIEPAIFLSLGRLLAVTAAPSFGTDAIQTILTRNRADNLDALTEREQATLRRVSGSRPTYAPAAGVYY